MKYLLALAAIGFLVTGCSDSDKSANVFEAQVESIDKAEAIEQQILDAAARQREAIEENSNQ